jgi:TPR repeat protein
MRKVGRWTMAVAMACCAAALAAAAPADDNRRGLQAYQRGDVVGAMAALRPAARAGHAPSQVLLAFILDRGDYPEEAALLYRQAAEQGDAEGQAGLANLLLTGRGIAKDEKAAFEQFSKAAAQGHAGAKQALEQLARPGAASAPQQR